MNKEEKNMDPKTKQLIEQIRNKAQARYEYDHDHEWLDELMAAVGEACGSADLKFEKPELGYTTIAMVGSLSEGFTAYGPFADFDAACKMADGDPSWIMTLEDPCNHGIKGQLVEKRLKHINEGNVKHGIPFMVKPFSAEALSQDIADALATKNPCRAVEVGNDIGPGERRPKVECSKCGEFKLVAKMIDGFELCADCAR